MKRKIMFATASLAIPALWLALSGPRSSGSVGRGAKGIPSVAEGERPLAGDPRTDWRLRAVEAELALVRRDREAAQLPASRGEGPAAPSASGAPKPERVEVDPDLFTARELERLDGSLRHQAVDAVATRRTQADLEARFARAGLERVRVDAVDCRETLCKLDLAFGELTSRDRDLSRAVDQLHVAFYANVADANSTSAEVYIALPGHDLSEAR